MKTLKLVRTDYEFDGIFGTLSDFDNPILICVTLEHAYVSGNGDGSYIPKVPKGEYTCVRGIHRLHDLHPFETFEVAGVTGHDNILFHVGNFNADSDGCILVGKEAHISSSISSISESRITFKKFMEHLQGINTFTLIVE